MKTSFFYPNVYYVFDSILFFVIFKNRDHLEFIELQVCSEELIRFISPDDLFVIFKEHSVFISFPLIFMMTFYHTFNF